MRKILKLSCFFFLTPILIALTLHFYTFISSQTASKFLAFQKTPKVTYAAIPGLNLAFSLDTKEEDARVTTVKAFLSKYNSALAPYAQLIVATADKYGLDYRLLPAIAMQESTLCKKAPKNSYNCWGFGIYGKKVTRFSNYSEAIETVTKTLSKNYKGAGLETPEEIMTKYNPASSGEWAQGVSGIMQRLEI